MKLGGKLAQGVLLSFGCLGQATFACDCITHWETESIQLRLLLKLAGKGLHPQQWAPSTLATIVQAKLQAYCSHGIVVVWCSYCEQAGTVILVACCLMVSVCEVLALHGLLACHVSRACVRYRCHMAVYAASTLEVQYRHIRSWSLVRFQTQT